MPSSLPEASRRWVALLVVCVATLMNALDQTIVNVALPVMQRDLGFDQAALSWVVNAYLVAFGGSLLLAGRLGDLVGRKRVFMPGVALFTAASVVCGLADSQLVLIAARFAQGLGAALSSSVVVAIIVAEFPDAVERAKAMSLYVIVTVGGGAIGLILGGVLTQSVGWHWSFLINLPIGLASLVAAWRLVPDYDGLGLAEGLDVAGSVLATGGLMLAIYAIVTAGQLDPGVTGLVGGAATVLLATFLLLQARLANPIMPLRILRAPGLVTSSAVRGLAVVGMYGPFFLGALQFEHVRGFDALQTGLAFLPVSISVLALSLGATTRMMCLLGAKRTAILGLALMLGSMLCFVRADAESGYFPVLFAGYLLMGLGGGTMFTPLLTIAVADIPARDAGLGSGIVNVSFNVAAAFAVAILGTISSTYSGLLLAQGAAPLSALEGGYHAGYLVAAGVVAVGLLLAVVALRGDRQMPEYGSKVVDGRSQRAGRSVRSPAVDLS